ncbi:MAG: acetolactate synthase 3 large subunit [Gammaproteobacteria bacterium]|nr:acetolactate synthase 3 large subunit [Gammaproteobacteria bacterium]
MELLSGADMLIRSLEAEGVEQIFGYPGGSVLHIYDALYRHKTVEHFLVRHEQAAAHMADGYARATGKVGVVLATSGPGATNTITGIATAYMDSIPMVILSGQVPGHLVGEDAFQETDMLGVSRPVVKHSFAVKCASEIPETIKKAFYIASTGRKGPVLIDLPKNVTNPADLFEYTKPEKVVMRSYNPVSRGHAGQIKKAVDEIMRAKRPIIYSGGGVVQGNSSDLLVQLVEKLGCPITCTLMGLGAYPGDAKQSVGMLGMHGTYEANMAMHNADVIIAIGARFDDRVTNNPAKFCTEATIIHIDIDPASISKTITADIPIVGSVQQVLGDMLGQLGRTKDSVDAEALEAWWARIEEWRGKQCLSYDVPVGEKMKPQQVVETLWKVTNGDAYVTSDVGQHQMFTAQYYKFKRPRQWINSGGLGTMGFGLPAAMGVQVACPDKTVVCVTGEGSIQMNIQELSTCLQYRLPVKIININNQALGMVKQWQDMQYDKRHSHSYMESLPDFVKLVEAYGHVGMRVDDFADLEAAMEECFALKDRLVFMDIYVDPNEHVYPMSIAGESMKDMILSKTERT